MYDRAHSDIRCIVGSYRTQADYDGRPHIVFHFDLSAVFLDVCQSVLYQSVDHSGCIVLPDGRILWSNIDSIGRTISSTSTGLGTAYNVAVMLFGGFAPFFVTWLIQTTGLPVAPAFYVMFGAAAGLLASLLLKEPARDVDLTATDLEVALS